MRRRPDDEAEPPGEIVDFRVDGADGRLAERDVLVDGVHAQDARIAVGGGVELADEPVAEQDRQRVVAPAALGGGFVHFQLVVEVEQFDLRLRSAISRSKGDSSAARPVNGRPSWSGSTRQRPRTPSTTASSPASPTSSGSTGHSALRARAMPSARNLRSSRRRRASSAGMTSSGG
jgi:hypothetical protein